MLDARRGVHAHFRSVGEGAGSRSASKDPTRRSPSRPQGKRAILNKLIEAEGFEKFIDIKYTGTKRFGLDGAESVIPALEQIIKRGGALGVRDIVLGMAHRGRLNVLAQVMGKPHRAIFHEFKGGSYAPDDVEGSGDVKYHLGASSDREFDGNKVHLSLTANPSHLEIVDPVVLGKARAKQDQLQDKERSKVLPLLLHGDAAFAGQGVVAECFGLSGLRGHRTGGSLHVIINNQIGFTTNPRWCAHVALSIRRGEDDRGADLPCQRRRSGGGGLRGQGGDRVPAAIPQARRHRHVLLSPLRPQRRRRAGFHAAAHVQGDRHSSDDRLRSTPRSWRSEGVIAAEEVDAAKERWRNHLEEEFEVGQSYKPNKADWLDGAWSGLATAEGERRAPGGRDRGPESSKLKELGVALVSVPRDFNIHRTVKRFLDNRRKVIETGNGVDWAFGEALAFGTLLKEGFKVRLSGQDVERGTFSQRHAVLFDQDTEKRYTSLNHLGGEQASFEVVNSMLSEEAVLGFEYGYSLAEPKALTLWEAQFGDFANGAQVVVDQFISSGEREMAAGCLGLVMLLPHGYEGQGPEHSSARLERYLQLCAEDNMQVANCTTPANYFHILRRQMHRNFRKPLILMTPKSLLRHKRSVSRLDELAEGSTFHRLLYDDAEMLKGEKVALVPDASMRRVVICSGQGLLRPLRGA